MSTGPKTDAPVVLLKTWKPWLTIWTYCVRPTSPFVSGGAQLQLTPGNAMPSKFRVGGGITLGADALLWRAASGTLARECWWRILKTGIDRLCEGLYGTAGTSRSDRETSFLYEWPTKTWRPTCFGSEGSRGPFRDIAVARD